jgi:hypothetical protein
MHRSNFSYICQSFTSKMLLSCLLLGITAPLLADNKSTLLADREAVERELAYQLAPVKSMDELKEYLKTAAPQQSPLNNLSQGPKERFLKSLVFTERGLASFDYRDLNNELGASEIYQLLSIFGVQRTTFSIPDLRADTTADEYVIMLSCPGGDMSTGLCGDHEGYWCSSPSTCTELGGNICMSSC